MSITKIAEVANNVLDKFVQDKDLKEQLSHDLQKELISLFKKAYSNLCICNLMLKIVNCIHCTVPYCI